MELPVLPAGAGSLEAVAAVGWNIVRVEADQVWGLGYTGRGVVVGGQDTGYQWDHPALIGRYRGWDGAAASHDYNWHDAIHSGGGICGYDTTAPCDDNGHGTHTLGTAVGDDGGVNRIGVAPGARWIGCRNMNQGVGTPATYAECFQGIDGAVAPFLTTMEGTRIKASQLKELLPENNRYMPVVPQILSKTAEKFIVLAQALFDLGYETVNWNLGCPFARVAQKKRGSGLLPHPELVQAFLDKTLAAIPNRLSIKTRLGRRRAPQGALEPGLAHP